MPLTAWLQVLAYLSLSLAGLAAPALCLVHATSLLGRLVWAGVLLTALLIALLLCWIFIPRFDWDAVPALLCLPGSQRRRSQGRSPFAGQLRQGGPARIAFTFDDGPSVPDTATILDVLRAHEARATFFCVGARAAQEPGLLARIASEGHVIGNHTQDHKKLTLLSRAQIAHQIDAAQDSITRCGAPAPTWFRAPHGFKSPWLFPLLAQRGLRLCAWTHGVWDTDRPGVAGIVKRASRYLRDGEILLLHDGGGDRSQTAAALDLLLRECKRRHLLPVTVPEILGP